MDSENTNNSESTLSVTAYLLPALLLALVGWVGLVALAYYSLPTTGPLWLFFFLLLLAATGTALPLAAFLNRRFASRPPAATGVVYREALWVGLFAATLAWLRVGRVLTLPLGLLLGVGFVLIEGLLRLREHSQWRP